MKRIVLLSVIIIFVILYFLMNPIVFEKKRNLFFNTPQISENGLRNYEARLKLINQFEILEGKGIFRMFSDGTSIWAIDNMGDVNRIKVETQTVEAGIVKNGGAPFENNQLSSIRAEDENLHLVDMGNNSIRTQNGLKNLLQRKKLRDPIYNGVSLKGSKFLTITDLGPKSAFQLVDIRSKPIWSKELIKVFDLPKTDFPEIVTEGVFTYNQSNNTFYVPGRFGKFVSFDTTGQINYIAETIDHTAPPKAYTKPIVKGSDAVMFVREPDFYVNYSCTADHEYLYILSLHKINRSDNFRTIDAYDVNNGAYSYSIAVPNFGNQLPIEIAVLNDKRLFILYENYEVALFDIVQ